MEGVDYSKSYMQFKVSGQVQNDHFDPEDRDLNGKGYYGFTCEVNSIQMAERISAVFHYGDGKTISNVHSVKEYVESYDDKRLEQEKETTTALVHAIADYGHFAQPILAKEHGWTIGREYAKMHTQYRTFFDYSEVLEATAGYQMTRMRRQPR